MFTRFATIALLASFASVASADEVNVEAMMNQCIEQEDLVCVGYMTQVHSQLYLHSVMTRSAIVAEKNNKQPAAKLRRGAAKSALDAATRDLYYIKTRYPAVWEKR